MIIKQNISLKPFNTFAIDVQAEYFTEIGSLTEFQALREEKVYADQKPLVLGGGSNVLFTRNYAGLVIKNNLKGIQVVKEDNVHTWIKVSAGENWHNFVMWCVQNGHAGLENLSLIPGCVGAAPMQNIG